MQVRVAAVISAACTAACLASAPAAAQEAGTPELLRAEGSRWELYAPSQEAIERGRQGLDHVVAQYEQIFGEPPVDLVFVLHDTNEQAAAYAGRFPGRPVQLWINSRVRGASPTGEGGTVVFTSTETIAHEAMHALVRARLRRPLPPWLNEGLASFIEPPVGELKRDWSRLRHLAPHVVSIRDLLVMPHPASRGVPSPGASGNVITMTVQGGPADALLYPQGMAVLEYLAEVEGVRFIGHLVDGIASGATLEAVLAETARLPSDLDVLNRDFRTWLVGRGIPLPDQKNDAHNMEI